MIRLLVYFAALKRKGKGSDIEEADMEAVVHAHNSKWPQAALVLLLISIVFQQQYSLLTCPPPIALYSLYLRNCY